MHGLLQKQTCTIEMLVVALLQGNHRHSQVGLVDDAELPVATLLTRYQRPSLDILQPRRLISKDS